jgi:hypothetical protein
MGITATASRAVLRQDARNCASVFSAPLPHPSAASIVAAGTVATAGPVGLRPTTARDEMRAESASDSEDSDSRPLAAVN